MRNSSTCAVQFLAGIILSFSIISTVIAQNPISESPDLIRNELRMMIENVTGADAYVYDAHDNTGKGMGTVKIIEDPQGGYLAIYHTDDDGIFSVNIATSTDLIHWTFQHQLGYRAAQPYLVALSDGGFVAIWEQESEQKPTINLSFRYYGNRTDLLNGMASRYFDAPITLSECGEGTANIYSVQLSPDIDHSIIDVGAHYHGNCERDLQHRGTLTNFTLFETVPQPALDDALIQWGVTGHIGDRDTVLYKEQSFLLIEGQYVLDDWSSWRTFLIDEQTGDVEQLRIATHGGSRSFANPTITKLRSPTGQNAVVITLFIHGTGAASGESGQLIYYRTYDAESSLAMQTPQAELALNQALELAGTGFSSNADWQAVYPNGFTWEFDGVLMVLVPAGCFQMGNDPDGINWDGESWEQGVPDGGQICIEPFWIDRTEVTQSDFEDLDGAKANENAFRGYYRPVENITWAEAQDFCQQRGARLPTEAEWEYAARGVDGFFFPWGNDFVSEYAVWNHDPSRGTSEVASIPAGASWVGAVDMSGNVWEWVNSLYVPYPYDADDGREADTNTLSARGLRGSSWFGDVNLLLRATLRSWSDPAVLTDFWGFRCARSVN